jgi:hypothetical protein
VTVRWCQQCGRLEKTQMFDGTRRCELAPRRAWVCGQRVVNSLLHLQEY